MADKEEIRKRLRLLRANMKTAGIDFCLITSTDPHTSEYVSDHDKVSEYFSGCTSDNARLLIGLSDAWLWTDGRYFISASRELEDTGIVLMRERTPGVPFVTEYLADALKEGMTLGIDGRCVTARFGKEIREAARKAGARIEMFRPADGVWADRPARPCHPVTVLSEEYAGSTVGERLDAVREIMKEKGVSYHVISSLDDIMWLMTIRGSDVACCPVALSYCMIGMETVDLFLQQGAVTEELKDLCLSGHIKIHDYDEVFSYIREYHFDGEVLVDPGQTSDELLTLLEQKADIRRDRNITTDLKAVKNFTEIQNSRDVYIQDSAAVCRFIFRIKNMIGTEKLTELEAAEMMDNCRREIPGFLDLSFPTISAYNANAAMPHYAATSESNSLICANGFLLVDSGGQYMGGTTDVTRTIAVGPLEEEMKRDFTLVAVSNLALLDAKFPAGTTGTQLDMLAREPLYRYGITYDHGTGHGVGYMLNVHEGPQRIGIPVSGRDDAPFKPGMITSDEPGIYREGKYGVRTESIMLCVKDESNEFGDFMHFEPLTLVPIDRDALDPAYMSDEDIARLNRYHQQVFEAVSPYLTEEERDWLGAAAAPMER